jgi:hypothetical protein
MEEEFNKDIEILKKSTWYSGNYKQNSQIKNSLKAFQLEWDKLKIEYQKLKIE